MECLVSVWSHPMTCQKFWFSSAILYQNWWLIVYHLHGMIYCKGSYLFSLEPFIFHFLIIYCLNAPVIDVYRVYTEIVSYCENDLLLSGISYVCHFLTWLLFLFILSWISMSIYLSYLWYKCVALSSLIFFHMIIFF